MIAPLLRILRPSTEKNMGVLSRASGTTGCLALALGGGPAEGAPQALARSERFVSYRIEASLDPAERLLEGRERVTWRNPSSGAVRELWFHLYLNAFKNDRTTLMRERGRRGEDRKTREEDWGWIDVESVRTEGGVPLVPEFMRPDDDNLDDETVMRVVLPEPVAGAGSVTLEIEFAAKFPAGLGARNQTKDGFFLGVQWFPKLGVFEQRRERGKPTGVYEWNCHQFHAASEFYADFGTYEVSLTLPMEYRGKAGATGIPVGDPEEIDGGERFRVRYLAEDVHDFAWVADPDFLVETRTFKESVFRSPEEENEMVAALGVGRESLSLPDVEVVLLLQPEHASQAERHFQAVCQAIYRFGLWYGAYPYRRITVVDPPWGAPGPGGMEYPMLITGGTDLYLLDHRHVPEHVLVHEFGHQYWYGLVANNEFEHAWLDEGFNSYSTGRILDRAFGPYRSAEETAGIPYYAHPILSFPPRAAKGDLRALLRLEALQWKPFNLPIPNKSPDGFVTLPGFRLPLLRDDSFLTFLRDLPVLSFPTRVETEATEASRHGYLEDPKSDPLDRFAWKYLDRSSYGRNSYSRPATLLHTMEAFLDRKRSPGTWARVMRTYHERFRFRHPVPEDFFDVVREVVGEEVGGVEVGGFLERTVYGSDVLDYGVHLVESEPVSRRRGVFGRGREWEPPSDAADGERREEETPEERTGPHDSRVVVRRYGEIVVPVTIEVKFEGQDTPERLEWRVEEKTKEERHWEKRWAAGPRLEWVRVDPDRIWLLDADLSNNTRRLEPDRAAAARWGAQVLFWVQNVLHFFGGIG
jgi:hypothetical protein